MKAHVIQSMRLNEVYGNENMKDIDEYMRCAIPLTGMNNPTWIIGHIITSYASVLKMIGVTADVPADWEGLFGMNTTADEDASKYPDVETLMTAYAEVHNVMAEALENTPAETLAAPTPVEEIKDVFPTVGDLVIGIATTHEGIHLGQLCGWRQAMGMDVPI